VIYLDNAATSWPKPEAVVEAATTALRDDGGNPGRGGHRMALRASRHLAGTRAALTELFGIADPERIVLGPNATWAINLALKGILKPGDEVVTGSMEHNAVLRPLWALAQRGVKITKARTSPTAGLDPDEVKKALGPATRLVVTGLASNVGGAISPVAGIGSLCRELGIPFLVDAAQGAGSIPIDVEAMGIDLLAAPGHKGLLGPQGTGFLYIAPGLELATLVEGGTGTESSHYEQPDSLPERHESGTPNTPGIAGLGAALRFILATGVEAIGRRESLLCERLHRGLAGLPGLRVYGPPPGAARASLISLAIEGLAAEDAAAILDEAYDIAARAGLHCAPDAHAELGSLGTGLLRLSPGYFTTEAEIDACIGAVAAIARDAASMGATSTGAGRTGS
jgi:cysteine desulfurase family protein